MANDHAKKHTCSWEDCGKAFSRSDHLQRHMLNHSSEGSTCERCRAHFKRPDLLERHMQRHQQKDEEAGGPGRGTVETRKRMWLDSDGQTIVSKRPSLARARPSTNGIAMPHDEGQLQAGNIQAPPSPPKSQPGTDLSEPLAQYQTDVQLDNSQQIFDYVPQMPLHEQNTQDMYDFLANSSWGQKSAQTTAGINRPQESRLWDEAFAPDTASSFNMPYTTMNNYSWLFDVSATSAGLDSQMQSQMNNWMPQMTNETLHAFNQSSASMPPPIPPTTGAVQQAFSGHNTQARQSLPMQAFLAQNEYQPLASMAESTFPPPAQRTLSTSQASETQSATSASPQALSASDYTAPSSHTSASKASAISRPSSAKSRPAGAPFLESCTVHSFHPCSTPRSLPQIDEAARRRILDMIMQANTRTPDGMLVSRDHPLLSLGSLQNYISLFFTHFNNVYPLIHKSTFNPSAADTLHLLAIVLLGATYSEKSAHRLAVCIHDIMRPQIFQHVDFTATPQLWMLQTILLVECFGKSRAGQKQHDMSHLFHGLLINLIRRSNCQTVGQPDFTNSTEDLETQWRIAMDAESCKRLAFLCFMWDTQHAVLFSQSLCMSSFELRAAMPCGPSVWEAESAEEWQHHSIQEPPPKLFLPTLKAYMSPSTPTPTRSHNLNALSRLLILHGLMSVSWDMKRRDDTSLGCGSLIGTDDWRARIGASYDLWRAEFDTYCLNISSSLNKAHSSNNPNIRSDFQRFTTSTLAIYHAAHIILNVEVLDLQIYAGARHIIGRPVSRSDFDRSRRKLRDWVRQQKTTDTTSSCTAVWHAAHLLRDGIMHLDNWDVNNAFHYPWCLYLATLTCWAFHYGSRDDDRQNANSNPNSNGSPNKPSFSNYDAQNEDAISLSMGLYSEDTDMMAMMMWEAKAEMNSLVSGMTSGVPDGLWRVAGKYNTRGLTTVMAQHLSNVRWAVIHEGMKVLKGLVTGVRQETF